MCRLSQRSPPAAALQAKAGLADEAFATYRAMRAEGQRPTTWTFSSLLAACGRAGRAQRAAEVVARMMPQVRGQ